MRQTGEDALRPDGVEAAGLEAISLTGMLQDLGGQYLFQGAVRAELSGRCVRCLEAARQAVEVEITWLFESGVEPASGTGDAWDEEDDEEAPRVSRFAGPELDLAPMLWEELALALPSKLVCKEECAGLCPSCGARLDEGGCLCESGREARAGGLAALRDLFPDLPSGPEKE